MEETLTSRLTGGWSLDMIAPELVEVWNSGPYAYQGKDKNRLDCLCVLVISVDQYGGREIL